MNPQVPAMNTQVSTIIKNCLTAIALHPTVPEHALRASKILHNLMGCEAFRTYYRWDDESKKQLRGVVAALMVRIAAIGSVPLDAQGPLGASEILKNVLEVVAMQSEWGMLLVDP